MIVSRGSSPGLRTIRSNCSNGNGACGSSPCGGMSATTSCSTRDIPRSRSGRAAKSVSSMPSGSGQPGGCQAVRSRPTIWLRDVSRKPRCCRKSRVCWSPSRISSRQVSRPSPRRWSRQAATSPPPMPWPRFSSGTQTRPSPNDAFRSAVSRWQKPAPTASPSRNATKFARSGSTSAQNAVSSTVTGISGSVRLRISTHAGSWSSSMWRISNTRRSLPKESGNATPRFSRGCRPARPSG